MYTPNPNDDLRRHVHDTADPYNSPAPGGSGRGTVITLLFIVVLIGTLIALSSIGEEPAEAPAAATDNPAPDSITGGNTPPE